MEQTTTINIANITFGEYMQLSEIAKMDYDFAIKYGDLEIKDYVSDISLEDRSFETVKNLMDSENEEELIVKIYEIEEYDEDKIVNLPFYQVILTFRYLIEHIVKLIKIENDILQSKVPSFTDYSDKISYIDFSMFPNYYSQLILLAQNDITKFEAIKKMKYSDCIVELLYSNKENDLQKMIDNQNRQKK
jgi:ABC-type methionine transport system ATPase subunit